MSLGIIALLVLYLKWLQSKPHIAARVTLLGDEAGNRVSSMVEEHGYGPLIPFLDQYGRCNGRAS